MDHICPNTTNQANHVHCIWWNACHLRIGGWNLRLLTCLQANLFSNKIKIIRLNLINHLLALFRAKFACNLAINNPVFRWESCKGSVWKSVKKCSSLYKIAGTHGWLAASKLPDDAHEWSMQRRWTITPTGALQGKKSNMVILFAHDLNSRLNQVARPSRQPTLFWKT